MKWLLYALLAPVLWSLSNLLDKLLLSRYVPKVSTLTLFSSVVGIGVAGIIFVINGMPVLSGVQMLLILFAGVSQIIMLLLYFQAMSLDETTRVVPLYQITPVFILVMGYLFLGEKLKPVDLAGFALIFAGSFIISVDKYEGRMFRLRPAFWYVLLSGFFGALGSVIFKGILLTNDFWTVFGYENLGIGLGGILLLLIPDYRRQFTETLPVLQKRVYLLILFNESLYLFGRMGVRYALTFVPVAMVSVVAGLSPMFLFIFSILITLYIPQWIKEDISRQTLVYKFISILVIFGGIYLMSR